MELLAIVAALQLAVHIQTPTTKEIVTDSLGCYQIANRRKRHPQLNNYYIALMNPLQHYLKDFKGTLRWNPAHPEKRNSMSANWSSDDCLNHVADRVAGGQTDFDIDFQYNFIQLQAEDIMESLVLPNSWTLNMDDGSTPILAGLQQQIDNWRLVTYLQRRDEYKAEIIILRPPRWTDTTPSLAA